MQSADGPASVVEIVVYVGPPLAVGGRVDRFVRHSHSLIMRHLRMVPDGAALAAVGWRPRRSSLAARSE